MLKRIGLFGVMLVAALVPMQDASAKESHAWVMDFGEDATVPVGKDGDLKNVQTDRCLVPGKGLPALTEDVHGSREGVPDPLDDLSDQAEKGRRALEGLANRAEKGRDKLKGLSERAAKGRRMLKGLADRVEKGRSALKGLAGRAERGRDALKGLSGLTPDDALEGLSSLVQTDWDLARCGQKQVKFLRKDPSATGPLVCGEVFALQLGHACYSKCTDEQQRLGINICSESCGREAQYQWQFRGCEIGKPVKPNTPVALWNTVRQDSLVYGARPSKIADICWADKELGGNCTTVRDE